MNYMCLADGCCVEVEEPNYYCEHHSPPINECSCKGITHDPETCAILQKKWRDAFGDGPTASEDALWNKAIDAAVQRLREHNVWPLEVRVVEECIETVRKLRR